MGFDRLGLAAVAAALAYLIFLIGEKASLRRARARLGIVVHVNGTRGKSETVRLLAAALRASGVPTLAKTTGTLPLLILPDGSERGIRRWGAANVREQRDLLRLAARLGARALVAECMAVSADAQAASTAFLAPGILLLTNSRPDHEAELGTNTDAAQVYAEGIPAGGAVLTADDAIFPLLGRVAAARGARCVLASPLEDEGIVAVAANAGLALAAAEFLGIPRDAALRGMRAHRADPGAFAVRELPAADGGVVTIFDALAANDPVSSEMLLSGAEARRDPPGRGDTYLLLATRADRPDRSLAFAAWSARAKARYARVLIVGPLGARARRIIGRPIERLHARTAIHRLAELPGGSVVHAVGNWKGLGPALAAATGATVAAGSPGCMERPR